jgi:hypothetical protein
VRVDRARLAGAVVAGFALAALAGGCVTSGGAPHTTGTALSGSAAAMTAAAPLREAPPATEIAKAAEPEAGAPATHYVEFRARPGPLIGHTYVVYGPLDKRGRPAEKNYVGLLPKGGVAGLAAGAAPVPIPATLEPAWADRNLAPWVSYREDIDAERYARLLAFVEEAHGKDHYWNLWVYNCNDFAADLAQAIGLEAPALRTVVSQVFVAGMRAMNQKGEDGPGRRAGPPAHLPAHLYERAAHES